jgi:hypothetical protein
MAKWYVTTSRLCWVDFHHAIEADTADDAEAMAAYLSDADGDYLGHSVGDEIGDEPDEVTVSRTRPVILHPDLPAAVSNRTLAAVPDLLALLRNVLPWLEAAEDLSDDPANLGELRALQGRGRAILAEAGEGA